MKNKDQELDLEMKGKAINVWDLPYKHYSADAGGVLIGNESFMTRFDNGYGDVLNKRVILIEDTSFTPLMIRQPLRHAGTFMGKGYVYDYDIQEDAKPLYEVSGEYSVYQILDDIDVENPNLRPMPTGCMLIIRMSE